MQGNEHSDQELLVLGLEWEREAIDYASQDLQQLSNPIEVLRLVNKPRRGDKIEASIFLFPSLWWLVCYSMNSVWKSTYLTL